MQINKTWCKIHTNNLIDKAIKVIELNTQLLPDAFNTLDSLAEALWQRVISTRPQCSIKNQCRLIR
jgi:hypothetical protein